MISVDYLVCIGGGGSGVGGDGGDKMVVKMTKGKQAAPSNSFQVKCYLSDIQGLKFIHQ